ncbi:unnamed protein product [Brassicogethes aeneus]|uniref:N(4)-(Beta-N-acetylglucosaminyl)-L-asparaginase n=1 Tax=Brassicogethes aeneus TaxID=1431903 RepID=A0A9P0BGG8_BRAAE|nr:unnamed protein product [Brassicogethes aeneus]
MMLEREETLSTNHSTKMYEDWKKNNCQPNFWQNVHPDPTKNCGPYIYATNEITKDGGNSVFGDKNHDTIGMIVVNSNGHVVAGTSTNGATHKIPGRVGDGPIPGAGAYADNDVGAAVATGDGDIMMRFLPSFLSVELMRNGASPSKAAKMAIHRIARKYPRFLWSSSGSFQKR